MNMRKNTARIQKKRFRFPPFSPPAQKLMLFGLFPILFEMLWICASIHESLPKDPVGTVHYYGGMLEYPLAALMLLTGACLLLDWLWRREHGT